MGGQLARVSYDSANAPRIQDTLGNVAASFDNVLVTNQVAACATAPVRVERA